MTIPKPEPQVERFEKLGYGMFIHWGLYAILGKGEWAQCHLRIPMEEYRKMKDQFTAAKFDGRKIAKTAKAAGMRYITLTTRHHEGFSLYDTRGLTDFDAPHSPAGRDLIADFVAGCRAEGIVPFFYHTTLDWYQESFTKDFNAYLEYLRQSVEVLCRNYGPIGGLWFDGNWSKPAGTDWKETELYATIRKYQPEAIIINNTGMHATGALGHPEIDSVTYEQGRPRPINREGLPKYVAGEMCQTMNTFWGLGREDFCYRSPKEIIQNLAACRKVGANYLLNVGPTAEGEIPDYETATLIRVAPWVKRYEKIIYEGKPTEITGQGPDFALELDGKVYLFIYNLAIADHADVIVGDVGGTGPRAFTGLKQTVKSARWLDNDEKLDFSQNPQTGLFCVNATGYPYGTNLVVRVAEVG